MTLAVRPETFTLPAERTDRCRVSVDEYKLFRSQGFLVVRGLVSPDEIAELREHTEDLMQGRLPQQQERAQGVSDSTTGQQLLGAPPAHLSPEEKANYFLRIHMLHRQLELHERFMLHPRVLDVLEAIIGPDVLAMQTMLFLKGPGKPGQGWHQDSFYIPTHSDSLCGAWIAVDDVDELNGAMWFAAGSNAEPVYPAAAERNGFGGYGDTTLANIEHVAGISDPDDARNDLARIADTYPQLLCAAKAGDVVFFGGHVLHRSKQNWSQDRFRRAFVSHYCNARSFTQWGADPDAAEGSDPITGQTNSSHILARGDTHLPFAHPKFGTFCAAVLPADERRRQSEHAQSMMGNIEAGLMDMMPAKPDLDHDQADAGVM